LIKVSVKAWSSHAALYYTTAIPFYPLREENKKDRAAETQEDR
jgi:hypothetical protein